MIYVDPLMNHGWILRGHAVQNCHLFTDSDLDGLHLIAARAGLKRRWFQNEKIPHYDLVQSRRDAAVAEGAIEVSIAQAAHLFKAIRKGLPLDSERRVVALLEGTLAGLQRSNVETCRKLARTFHQVLAADPLARDVFDALQQPCNCKQAADGHAQMCPRRLNAYLDYLANGEL